MKWVFVDSENTNWGSSCIVFGRLFYVHEVEGLLVIDALSSGCEIAYSISVRILLVLICPQSEVLLR